MVQLAAEHIVAHVVELDDTDQTIILVEHGEEVATRVGDDRREAPQLHIGCRGLEILLDDILGAHEREDRLVLMVCEEFALLGQTHGVDEIELSKIEDGKTTLDQTLSKTLTDEAEGKTTYILDFDKLGLSGKFEITVIDKDGGKTEMDVTVGAAAATYNFSAKSIAVEAGKEYVYSKKAGEGAAEGSFKVTVAEAGSVTLEIGGKTVTLSDAGASWLSNDFEAWKNADVTNGADVLLCLLKESTNIAGATESSNEVISGQASATYFAAK